MPRAFIHSLYPSPYIQRQVDRQDRTEQNRDRGFCCTEITPETDPKLAEEVEEEEEEDRITNTMPLQNVVVGRYEEASHPDTFKSAIAEFISTLLFVFAGEGSVISYGINTHDP